MRLSMCIAVAWCAAAARCALHDAPHDALLHALSDVLRDQHRPTTVVLHPSCWTRGDVRRLALAAHELGASFGTSLARLDDIFIKHHVLFVMDLDCPQSKDYLLMASERGLTKAPYRWILLNDSRGRRLDAEAALAGVYLLPDSDLALCERHEDDRFSITGLYRVSSGARLLHEALYGGWRAGGLEGGRAGVLCDGGGLLCAGDGRARVLAVRRRDLRGAPIRVSAVITDSNRSRHHLEDRKELQYDSLAKISYAIGSLAVEFMNGRRVPVLTDTWGYRDAHGNFTGLVEQLRTGEADIGTACLFTQDRSLAMEYVTMSVPTAVRFVFRQPPLSYVSNIYALPFEPSVWIAIAVCVLAAALALYIVAKWENSLDESHPLLLEDSWTDVFLLTMSAVCQQGCSVEPRHYAGRIVTFVLFTILMALYAAYSANVVVLLRAPSNAIRTVEDLLHSRLTLGTSDTPYNRYFFKNQNEPIRKAIYEKKIMPKGRREHFYSMKYGVEKIRQGLFAFHMEIGPGYRIMEETFLEGEKCGLVEIDYLNLYDPYVPIRKYSPYREHFKISLKRMREHGQQDVLNARIQTAKPKCAGGQAAFSTVGIIDFGPAALWMLYGFAVAFLILLAEICTHKRKQFMLRSRVANRSPDEDARAT